MKKTFHSGRLTISNPRGGLDDGKYVEIKLEDASSGNGISVVKITKESLMEAILGLACAPCEFVASKSGAERAGKKKIRKPYSVVIPKEAQLKDRDSVAIETAKQKMSEEGLAGGENPWILEEYLGAQGSWGQNSYGEPVARLSIIKYVSPEEYDAFELDQIVISEKQKKEYAEAVEKSKKERDSLILRAVSYHSKKWPEELDSGVMFFEGERITIKEFKSFVKLLK
jgi:hypothetical protein